tara:strand:+ start:555 stop:959 length:405 start_codon:yes stop_codon:yes gene_type:complete
MGNIALPAKAEATEEMTALAKSFFKLNREMNALKRDADKARKQLFTQMKDAGLDTFRTAAMVDNKKVILESVVNTPTKIEVDVEKLFEIVGSADFIEIVSATQKSVTDVAGKATLDRCSVEVDGTENVAVKAAK